MSEGGIPHIVAAILEEYPERLRFALADKHLQVVSASHADECSHSAEYPAEKVWPHPGCVEGCDTAAGKAEYASVIGVL